MDIYQKIEEIREKPEHIRIRYVWGAVFVCMFFIVLIWFFSFWNTLNNTSNENEKVEIFEELSEKKKTLEEYKNQAGGEIQGIKKGLEDMKNIEESKSEENL